MKRDMDYFTYEVNEKRKECLTKYGRDPEYLIQEEICELWR